ncbi:MAG TPA: 4'-phosphopantetheinyl transferase superfamily protein [Solirubrobacteraceae bacterium]|nr:4'-phosphopantetheinyl transferase superfamily protein [Solirubrobacteraceae bacterium]
MPDQGSTRPSTPLPTGIPEGALDIWIADLGAVGDDVPQLLSAAERARSESILGELTRRRWVAARALLRRLLGGYLQRDPGSLLFSQGPYGKPALREGAGAVGRAPAHGRVASDGLSFNVSHSGDLAVYAFTRSGSVGVDVEVAARRPRDPIALASRAFGPVEEARLRSLSPAARESEFLRAWTRREARLKCDGRGLGGAGRLPEAGPNLWVGQLDVGPHAAAAVAAERAPRELRRLVAAVAPGDRGRAGG